MDLKLVTHHFNKRIEQLTSTAIWIILNDKKLSITKENSNLLASRRQLNQNNKCIKQLTGTAIGLLYIKKL